jgi:hypothetical protein
MVPAWIHCLSDNDVQNFRAVMLLFVDGLFIFSGLGNKLHESMSFGILRIGSRALQHILIAMYSASVELSAISV